MTQPGSGTPVPTSQRPINGALSGLAAQMVGNMAAAYLMSHGVDPGTAAVAGTAAGSTASGAMATIADWSRTVLESGKVPVIGRLPFMFLARIG